VGEHLPLGLMAVFLLVFFVIALPVGTFIAVQRLVRDRSRWETAVEAVDTDVSDDERMWKAFFPGDYKAEYFWVRHQPKEYGQVPTHLFVPIILTSIWDLRDKPVGLRSRYWFFSPPSEAVSALPSSASCTSEFCSS
jgi:hypothetical protein